MAASVSAPILARPLAGRSRPALKSALLIALGLYAVQAATGFGGAAGADAFTSIHVGLIVVAAAICVDTARRRRGERLAWACFATALGTYAAGELAWNVLYAGTATPRYPSLADAFWVAFYPASYVGLVLLVRRRIRGFQASLWLDGLVAALAVAALTAAVLSPSVLEATGGSPAAVATTIAYPVGDILLLGFVVGVFALTGWRPGRSWAFLGAGLALNGVAHVIYTVQSANGTFVDGSIEDVLFPTAAIALAWSAFQAPDPAEDIELGGARMMAVPSTFALLALVLAGFGFAGRLNAVAAVLTMAALIAVTARAALTFSENVTMLRRSRHESLTDALTGLGNRRRLMADLDAELAQASHDCPRALLLFDLDGFKSYNDAFGHPEGDVLLTRLGVALEQATSGYGYAYRLGGDEFCVLACNEPHKLEAVVAGAAAALSERGEGYRVDNSHGVVLVPAEASCAAEALRLADERMYRHKQGRSSSARLLTRDLFQGVLREREPALREHHDQVSRLATHLGEALGLEGRVLEELSRAADLHDVGKVAVPDAILGKPGPLSAEEWRFIRRHTVVGERMLRLAPSLRPVASLVRSSHERFDGHGYPDGLSGSEIPLRARVLAVCDAFDAMLSPRAYRGAMDEEDALAEIRAGSGTQFDPVVVEAFCAARRRSPSKDLGERPAAAAQQLLP